MQKLLIIGRKENASVFVSFFKSQGLISTTADTEKKALSYFENELIELVIIINPFKDLNDNSISVRIRNISTVPIIIVLDREEKSEIIKVFNDGADAYLIEPVDQRELLARAEALLRRRGNVVKKNTVRII
jgi:DNA-binding response OmpR family regulator